MGKDTYRILKNRCEPAVHVTLDYKEHVAKLQDYYYFTLTTFAMAERHTFHKRNYDGGESVAQFAAKLCKLTRHCGLQYQEWLKTKKILHQEND